MKNILFLASFLLFLSACTEVQLASHVAKNSMPPSKTQGTFKVGNPYKINGKWYTPRETYDLVETGIASWYGPQFHGRQTANGEIFDKHELTAAHRTLQMPSLVRVTNLDNGRSLIVRVNDRGPYKRGRIIDVSERAAELLDFKTRGTAKVRLQVLKQESLQIAQAAKSGINTAGYEVALNNGGGVPSFPSPAPSSYQPAAGPSASAPAPVKRETLKTPSESHAGLQEIVPGHTRDGQFYPDPIVTEYPVSPTNIYVQAGAFTVQDNAMRLQAKLQQFANAGVYPADIDGRRFYRVRLGPVGTVEEADELLERLINSGNQDALIIVD